MKCKHCGQPIAEFDFYAERKKEWWHLPADVGNTVSITCRDAFGQRQDAEPSLT